MAKYQDELVLKDGVSKTLEKINKKLGETEKHFKKLDNIKKLNSGIKDFGKKMTIGVTLPIVAMGGAMVKAAADVEAMQQQLSTMLGSAEAGGQMFEEIKTMASKTPFGTKDLMEATNTMLAFGVAQKDIIPTMKMLGDISGGNAERFKSLVLNFSQIRSTSKLTGGDLRSLSGAGFNPLAIIAKKTGKSMAYWQEQMSKGKVSAEMVEDAMREVTKEGGKFYQMMEKQSRTAIGQWSTLQDNLNMLLADFGAIILPKAIKVVQKLSEMLEWFNSLSPATKRTIVILGGIIAVIGPLISILGGLASAIISVNLAFAFLSANPVILTIMGIVAGITALVAIIILAIKGIKKLVGWFKKLKSAKESANVDMATPEIASGVGSKISNSYSKRSFSTTNNNTNTTNNFYGNILNPSSAYLGDIIGTGGMMPAFGG